MATHIFLLGLLTFSVSQALASTVPSRYKTICVRSDANSSAILVDGFPCKDLKQVQPDDFFSSGLNTLGPFNRYGSAVAAASATEVPGLNTLGVSLVLATFKPSGIFPPHTNQADEILYITEGTLEVGLITPYPDNRLISKVLKKGEVFAIPAGPIHYQKNPGTTNATAIIALSSQDISPILVASSVFGSTPKISSDVLAASFHVDLKTIEGILTKF